ncbi:EAL domain-containing protein [Sphingomonas sp. MMS12-HWE2-04]|uniref:EAL domain-containing protein n=1 Tax=Sphingomonas sp. MMS12-HWE2-04 TaxID=3234199 RepID=UPI00384CC750
MFNPSATAATFEFRIGFQPMIAADAGQPFAWQAVAIGRCGRSFAAIAASLAPEARPALEAARITQSIAAAMDAGLGDTDALLALPLGAGAGMVDGMLTHLFRTALQHGLSTDRLVIEISADERGDHDCAAALAEACTTRGISVALDCFGAGPNALKLLARFTPRFVKLDPSLVRNIDASASRRLIAESVMRLARNMGVTVIARGAESRGEHAVLTQMGVRHFQIDAGLMPSQPHLLRREPRTIAATHRRLAHHQRTMPSRSEAPAGMALAV